MNQPSSEPLFQRLEFARLEPEVMQARARAWSECIQGRRSVREFSSDPIPSGVLDACIQAAASAPSGAHRQPWTFVVVTSAAKKRAIRLAAEAEEQVFWREKISPEWRRALGPLGVDEHKPFLEAAPALIVVFRHVHGLEDGHKVANYYTQESVGIAVGFLLCALHQAWLASLTHTPSPMGFLQTVLERPAHERAFVLIPVGYPARDCQVPALVRKPLDEVRLFA